MSRKSQRKRVIAHLIKELDGLSRLNEATVRKNVSRMTEKELKAVMSLNQDDIRDQAKAQTKGNKLWYH